MREEIRGILEKHKTVAVVGVSRDPAKDSYKVAEYLQSRGYRIIPINPFADEVLGKRCYKSLLDVPEDIKKTIEIVEIFRPAQDVPPIVEQAIQLRRKYGVPRVIWMQLGIVNREAAEQAKGEGLTVVMDRCMMMERKHMEEGGNRELERLRAKQVRELTTKVKESMKEEKSSKSVPITVEDTNFDKTVRRHSLMVVDCWTEWCGPCRMIEPVVEELAQQYAGKVVFGKLNVDENPQTAMRFNIVGIPTLLIMKNGLEVDRIIGVVPKEFIEEKLRKHL